MKPLIAWSMGAVLSVCAVGFVLQTLGQFDVAPDQKGPELLVDPPFVIMDANESDDREATVRITNTGRNHVRLLKITSSCGCTVADLPERERLEPGESTKMRIRGTPPSVGRKNTYVQIETDAAATKWLRINLLLKGKEWPVPRLVRFPDKVVLQNRRQRPEAITATFQLQTVEKEGSDYWLTVPPEVPDLLTLDSASPIESPGPESMLVSRSYGYTITGTVDPQQQWETTITMKTPLQQIPIRVVAEYVPPIKIVPNTLFIDLSSGDLTRATRTVRLIGGGTASVPQIQIDPTQDEWLQIRHVDATQSDESILAQFEISLSSTPPSTSSTIRRMIHIRTSDPDCPTLELPLVIKGTK